MSTPPRLILASSSSARQRILQEAGYRFDVVPANITEVLTHSHSPAEMAQSLALQKAHAVFREHPNCLVLGADQIAVLRGEMTGKPTDENDALQRLMTARGQTLSFVTGVALLGPTPGAQVTLVDETDVKMRDDYSESEVLSYIATGEGMPCAGALRIEGFGAFFVRRVVGDAFNLQGLPILLVAPHLRDHGISPGWLK